MNLLLFSHGAPFSAKTRQKNLARLKEELFDVLIIGGGVAGAAVANEAARRGYKVALVEQDDFAGGSSSKTSRLIHCGFHSLKTLKLSWTFEACRQRHRLFDLAPHLVRPLPFVWPLYRDNPQPQWQTRLSLWFYDALAEFSKFLTPSPKDSSPKWSPHQFWTAGEAVAKESLLTGADISRAACYYGYVADNARLTLVTLIDAHRLGAVLANYTKVVGFLQTDEQIVGTQIQDRQSGAEIEARAHLVISAAGPWTDKLLKSTNVSRQSQLHLTKGVHLVLRRERLPGQTALIFNTRRAKQFMVAVPWDSRVIVGPTDTIFDGDVDNVFATSEEVHSLLEAIQSAFPTVRLTEGDVLSTYAGLRPLISHSRRPDRSEANHFRSEEPRILETRPGLLTIAGGTFTTHRAIARQAVDKAAGVLARDHAKSLPPLKELRQLALPGGDVTDWESYQARQRTAIATMVGLPGDTIEHLINTYGAEVDDVLALISEKPALARRVTPDLPVIGAQVVYAVRREMALTLTDVLDRRTHILTHALDQGLGAVQTAANLMAAELGWTPQEFATQVAYYRYEAAKSHFWRDKQLSVIGNQ